MRYKNLIDNIRYISEKHKLVSTFEENDDIFQLNYTDNCYPVVFLTPREHLLGHPINTYNFTLYYIDRQLDDKSNRVDIHSATLKTINDICLAIDYLEDTETLGDVIVTLFNDKITDLCAGGWANISIQTVNVDTECNTLGDSLILPDGVTLISSELSTPITDENGTNLTIE